MCGIAGWCGPAPNAPTTLAAMLDTIVHRGPDDAGAFLEDGVALGMRRLSIIDLETGHQPISNEDGAITVVFNGEIYNFRTLRADLEARGHVFRTRTDTEVIVHAYEEWGESCPTRFDGMFAFALWDRPRQRLLLARDHFGVKPLYYTWDGRRLLFGSEIKTFRPFGVPQEVDPDGLDLALALGYVPSPFTLFRGVKKLPPGHLLSLTVGAEPRVERYWHPIPTSLSEPEDELVAGVRERLERAVQRQMVSDVPIGALLSGGIDSTAVVTLMRRFSHDVRTFSIGVRGAPAINELPAARRTAQRLGTRHAEIEIDVRDYTEFLATAYAFLEEPSTPSSLLTYFVCRLARDSVKVVLTGQGADELFGGYSRYVGERYGALYRRLPSLLTHRLLPAAARSLRAPLRIRRGIDALAESAADVRFRRINEVFSDGERAQLLGARQRSDFDIIETWSVGLESAPPLKQLQYIDARTSLSDNLLAFGDKMAMAASVEARVPFLDLELAAYAENIPSELHVRKGLRKQVLRRALAGLVPEATLRGKKLAFEVPQAAWFRGPLNHFLSDLLAGDAYLPRYLDRSLVETLLDEHRRGARNRWRHLFTLLSIELSCRGILRY